MNTGDGSVCCPRYLFSFQGLSLKNFFRDSSCYLYFFMLYLFYVRLFIFSGEKNANFKNEKQINR